MSDLRARLDAVCATLRGAEKSDPWGGGHDAWKVGGKMFACIGATNPGVSVKCPDVETAQMLIESGVGTKAPYFHASWVHLPDDVETAELEHRVRTAYEVIRDKLPKKTREAL